MTSSVQVFFCSLLFFNVVLLSSVVSHAASTNDVVSTICPNTTYPTFCSSVLKSAGSTDLKEIASFTLNLAHTNADKSQTLAKSMAEFNLQLKEKYLSCSENYGEAILEIEKAQNYLASGDFNGVDLATSGVMDKIEDCQGKMKDQSADDTLALLDKDKTLNDICSIILVISNLKMKPV